MRIPTRSAIAILIICSSLLFPAPAKANLWEKARNLFKTAPTTEEGAEIKPGISADDIRMAFKEALQIGSEEVVSQLGQSGGFSEDPAVHIPLPERLVPVREMLEKFGMGRVIGNLEAKLNEAAEAATPKAKAVFMQAISEMTFEDVKRIYNGPADSATQYFRERMSPQLTAELQPVIENSLAEVGAVRVFDEVMRKYRALPFAPEVDADLSGYVMSETLDGIFLYLAREEAAIRENPMRQTTELLKRVFSAK